MKALLRIALVAGLTVGFVPFAAAQAGDEGAELVLRPEQTTSCAVTRLGLDHTHVLGDTLARQLRVSRTGTVRGSTNLLTVVAGTLVIGERRWRMIQKRLKKPVMQHHQQGRSQHGKRDGHEQGVDHLTRR